MALRKYAKLFYDLDNATKFGNEIDYIAGETKVTVNDKGQSKPIFKSPEDNGEYHWIDKDVGSDDKDIYYVRYVTFSPRNAKHGDVVIAERKANVYLNEKHQELGPDTGVSMV